MSENTTYQQNWRKFAQIWPNDAAKVENADPTLMEWTKTSQGEPNLGVFLQEKPLFFHDPAGAQAESALWFKSLPLKDAKVLYVFGLGLGYFYQAAKDWLHADNDRFLLFFEPDLKVIRRFLETERASQILADPQVIIKACPQLLVNDLKGFWDEFDLFARGFSTFPYGITGLRIYAESFPQMYSAFKSQMQLQIFVHDKVWSEQIRLEPLFFRNFYHNLAQWPGSFDGQEILPDFKDKPAIICGAGPSLQGQFGLLGKLQDKAIIFGPGTAANLLTRHQIQPHFLVNFDPNSIQLNRALTHYAFETPAFYKYRYFFEALELTQGPRLQLRGGGDFLAGDYFEQALGLPKHEKIEGLISSSLLALCLAQRMGCNPIILTGLDLSSPTDQRYSAGIMDHPLETRGRSKSGNKMPADTYIVQGLDGKPVKTTVMWEIEKGAFSAEAAKTPGITILNATDGGLPIQGIPNVSLESIANQFLQKSGDIDNDIHRSLQVHGKLNVGFSQTKKALEDWIGSLERSLDAVKDKLNSLQNCLQYAEGSIEIPEEMDPVLLQEAAYQFYLEPLIKSYSNKTLFKRLQLQNYADQFSTQETAYRKLELAVDLYLFLHGRLAQNITLAHDAYAYMLKKETRIAGVPAGQSQALSDKPHPGMADTEKLEESKTFYPEGSLKQHWHELSGERHGPSRTYHPNGKLLSEAMYHHGVRQGECWQYDAAGRLYSLRRYIDGHLHGRQEYYWEDGSLKSAMEYREGKLNGTVRLYYPNGQIKRELNFMEGLLNGMERLWSWEGVMLIEVGYAKDKPVGKARMWYDNGRLAKEVKYHDSPEQFDLTEWDPEGKEIHKQVYEPENPIAQMLGKTKELEDAINKLQAQIDKLKSTER